MRPYFFKDFISIFSRSYFFNLVFKLRFFGRRQAVFLRAFRLAWRRCALETVELDPLCALETVELCPVLPLTFCAEVISSARF